MMSAEPNTQFECKLLDSGEKAFITVNTSHFRSVDFEVKKQPLATFI